MFPQTTTSIVPLLMDVNACERSHHLARSTRTVPVWPLNRKRLPHDLRRNMRGQLLQP